MEIIPPLYGGRMGTFDFSNKGQCFACKKIGPLDDPCVYGCQHMTYERLCHKTVQDLGDQQILPRCALVNFSRCELCKVIANRLSRMLSTEVNMASSVLKTIRAYDTMVYNGRVIKTDDDGTFKHLFNRADHHHFEPEKLLSCINHHHKSCLCSICKWVIVTNLDKTNLK